MFLKASGEWKVKGKAAEVKSFGRVLKILWQKHMNQNLQMHRMVLALLKLNCQMEQILAKNKAADALPTACAAKFVQACEQISHLQCLLFDHFAAEDIRWTLCK